MTTDPRRRGRWRGSGTLAAPTVAGPEAAATPGPAAGAVPATTVGPTPGPAAGRVAAWRRPGPERAPGPATPAAAAGRRERAGGQQRLWAGPHLNGPGPRVVQRRPGCGGSTRAGPHCRPRRSGRAARGGWVAGGLAATLSGAPLLRLGGDAPGARPAAQGRALVR